MEPDDQSLHHLLDTTQPAGPDDLRIIVAKAGRHRVRFASLAAGAALLIGGGAGGAIGYASSNHSNHAVQTAGSPQSGNSATAGSAASGATSLSPTGVPGALGSSVLTHAFTRTANGVEIRAYETPSRALPPAATPSCSIVSAPRLEAEVSTDKAVGTLSSGFLASNGTGAVKELSGDVFGVAEGDPVGIVVASASSSVKSVRVTFTGGATDQMAPSAGWVALAGPVPASWGKNATTNPAQIGTLTAYNASGTKVFSQMFSFGVSSLGTGAFVPGNFCGVCGGPILHPTPAAPPSAVSPGLPTTKNSSGVTSGPGFACPAIQGNAGAGSSSGGANG
jgi:hypothetical protein